MLLGGTGPASAGCVSDLPVTPPHHFSVDVEEYFQVNAFEPYAPREAWSSYPSRVEWTTDALLDVLAEFGATGTFFTLGWIGRYHPRLVRRIADAGHEVASHGDWHRKVTTLTPDEFREDVRASKAVLEQVTGQPVLGFRAPSFSIGPATAWAFDVLLEEGYAYDSSVFPIRRRGYGWPGAPTVPYVIRRPAGGLREYPLATLPLLGARIPAAGGGYLRQFPFGIIRAAFREAARHARSAMFYVHPWELDSAQPRLDVPWLTRVRHYRGLDATLPRIRELLREFRFSSIERLPVVTA
jgi:polysaccharide deacetylase family protein (PEP-CTERM system associated)